MFEDVKKDDRQIVSGSGPTEDMFADVDTSKDGQIPARPSAVAQGVIRPATGEQGEIGPAKPLRNLSELGVDESLMVHSSVVKRILIWLLSVAAIVIVGWGGYYVYINIIAPAMNQTSPEPAPTTSTTPIINANTNQPLNTNSATTTTNSNQVAIDSDKDGLSDVEEQLLGTDASSQDSDKDGLTDYEEVKIYGTDALNADTDNDGLTDREETITWHTNPKNPDTDGDGFQDGMEVKSGYNPAGPGKLSPDQLPSNQTVK